MSLERYVLITPARNEERFISRTLESVLGQTLLPLRWVIVSDGSTDRTDEIVQGYARRAKLIEFIRREQSNSRNFASKIHAFRDGLERLAGLDYRFIGNQDADCSLPADYYERVLRMFEADPRLGIAGGVCHERVGGQWKALRTDVDWSVSGAIQLFRCACFESVGGYIPLEVGGVDTAAEILARKHGWKVSANPNLVVLHHRQTGTATGTMLQARFREGVQEYLLGNPPVFQLCKAIYRTTEPPFLIGSIWRLLGYASLWVRNSEQCLPKDVIEFRKREQRQRLMALFRAWRTQRGTAPSI